MNTLYTSSPHNLTVSVSLGHAILENRRPSFLALAKICHVSSCSLYHAHKKETNIK